jgi:stage II sporulation protein D
MVNTTDEEKYLAGVVLSEGGRGQQPEFCKVQVVIARTYMYRYFNRHAADHYNLCDNTHCQAYNGLSDDSGIFKAISETSGEVITGPDSSLIISAFHSNCGGETAPSGSVWVSQEPYLVKINDPYCINSRNAVWEKSISLDEWTRYLRKSGYDGSVNDVLLLNISQKTRMDNLSFGNISIPVRQIRADFRLRSTFFSVLTDGDTVKFSGRGYGHGVGLCQEGAMEMASRGLEYKQIIKFYYSGVTIGSVSGFRTGMK